MPEKKSQHYVPRFYLKNFSDDDRRTINLFNIKRGIAISNASLRHQCCEPHFYDKTAEIERSFEKIENRVARIIDHILSAATIPPKMSKEYVVLLQYVILQRYRTKSAADEHDELFNQTCKILLGNDPELDKCLDRERMRTSNPAAGSLLIEAARSFPLAFDLEAIIVTNRSIEGFITSDNPVVFYNQFMENSRWDGCTGLESQGLQVFLPLSPEVMFHLYDAAVYRITMDKSRRCEIREEAEALKFNQLQWLNALENVYYSSQTSSASIDSQAKRFLPNRSTSPPRVIEYPKGAIDPFFVEKSDIRIRLRPHFVTIAKSKKKLLHSLEVPPVRNTGVVEKFTYFRKMNEGKPWTGVEFLKFLLGNGEQET